MTDYAFTNAILSGTYAVTVGGEGGCSPYAAIGLLTFDGAGSVSGHLTESQGGPSFNQRTIVLKPYQGRYRMNGNGLGTLHAAGSDEIDGYLALREVAEHGSSGIGQEIALIFGALDPASGSLRSGIGQRRTEAVAFSNASLRGRYTGFAVGRGGQTPMAGLGALRYDGAGSFSEENVANVQGETVVTRQFVSGTDQGTYSVEADGTGTVAGGGVLFVITRVSVSGGAARAEEYGFLVRDAAPTTGAYFTGVVRRISDLSV